MAQTPTPTRDRILEVCRRLFNERGPAVVTTALIAEAAEINEGNLYYYFKKKNDIVLALYDAFESDMGSERFRTETLDDGSTDYLMASFKMMWHWRFFYRDSVTLYEMVPALRARTKAVAARSHERMRRLLQYRVQKGRLNCTPEEIEQLVVNSWLIMTFWIHYLQSSQGVQRLTRAHLDWGYAQVQSLYKPYRVRAEDRPPRVEQDPPAGP